MKIIAWLNKEVNEKKLVTASSFCNSNTCKSSVPTFTSIGQSSSTLYPTRFDIAKKTAAYEVKTPHNGLAVHNFYQPKTLKEDVGTEVTRVPSYKANEGFIPQVTPNIIEKTPSKGVPNRSCFTTSEQLADTQPRRFTPTAIKINR